MARLDQRAALGLLTKPRLLDIAAAFDLDVAARLRKPDIVDVLIVSRKAAFRKILLLLKRDELKAVCRSAGMDDSGREKNRIVDRILRLGFPRSRTLAPKTALRALTDPDVGTITKAHLVEQVAEATGVTKVKAEDIVNGVIESLTGALVSGSRIEIRGFGTFAVRSRKPRIGRNPGTGARVKIPAKRVPFFKPGKELRVL